MKAEISKKSTGIKAFHTRRGRDINLSDQPISSYAIILYVSEIRNAEIYPSFNMTSLLLGHEISFYGGEILLGQPVRKHLFKSVCTCTYSQGVPRGGDVTFGAQKSRIRELRRRCETNLRQF